MDARDPAANNADLWSAFLREQWFAWLSSLGFTGANTTPTASFADAGAAAIAAWLGLTLGPAVAALYAANAAQVTRFLQESAIAPETTNLPPEFVRHAPRTFHGDPAQQRTPALVGAF